MSSILHKTCVIAVPFLQACFVERSIADTLASPKTLSTDQYYQNLLEYEIYAKPIFNIPPTPLIYPDYFAGTYQAELTFQNGYFTPYIPFSDLSQDANIAGFRRYSVAFVPDIGSNAKNALIKFRPSKDSSSASSNSLSVIEDRSTNVLSLFNAFSGQFSTEVDSIIYDEKKNCNRLSLQYHNPASTGKIELFTNSRSLIVTSPADSSGATTPLVRTLEHIRQSAVRQKSGQRASQTIVDYAIEWSLSPTSLTSSRSDATDITASDISKNSITSKTIPSDFIGTFRIFSYLQPQDELYFKRPVKPVAVFVYNAVLKRLV